MENLSVIYLKTTIDYQKGGRKNMAKQQFQAGFTKFDSPIVQDSKENSPYLSLSLALLELEYMREILLRIQKDASYLDLQEMRTLLGKVNEPLENYTRNLKELNEKARKLQ